MTSSTKTITGANLLAKEKRAFVSFSASPNHCAYIHTTINIRKTGANQSFPPEKEKYDLVIWYLFMDWVEMQVE